MLTETHRANTEYTSLHFSLHVFRATCQHKQVQLHTIMLSNTIELSESYIVDTLRRVCLSAVCAPSLGDQLNTLQCTSLDDI